MCSRNPVSAFRGLPLTLAGLSGFRLLWIDADPGHDTLNTLTRKGEDR